VNFDDQESSIPFQERGSDMKTSTLLPLVLAGAFASVPAIAQDKERDRDRDQTREPASTQARDRDQLRDRDIFGHELMTAKERNDFRARMRSAKTAQERDQIRAEHHEQMMARAKERGVKIPDAPPPGRGPGSGAGPGPAGGGAGPGGGAGGGGPGGK
jgi:hypothetical protein